MNHGAGRDRQGRRPELADGQPGQRPWLSDKFDFGFAVNWMRKDLGLVLDEAKRNGARLPVTALVDQFYADVQQAGGERWDTSSLIKRLRKPLTHAVPAGLSEDRDRFPQPSWACDLPGANPPCRAGGALCGPVRLH
jgi:hypothetical protein